MKRRSTAGRKPAKTRGRKIAMPKRRIAAKAVGRPRSASQETKLVRLARERDEALAGQTAMSEILRVISQSPTDVQPVFDSIVLTAARLLRCDLVFVLRCDGATFSTATAATPEGSLPGGGPKNLPIDPSANFPSRAILDKKMLHLPDWSLIKLPEHERRIREMFGVNSALYLPLLRKGECIGLLTLAGKRPNAFGAAEIVQAESFRDQALIAIENTRLFDDVQQRTAELTESLEQQTATSEILASISGSLTDSQPVFDSIVRNLLRLFGASTALVALLRDGMIHVGALGGEAGFEKMADRYPLPLDASTVPGRAMLSKHVVQLAPIIGNPDTPTASVQFARDFGFNSLISAPMIRGDKVIGAIIAARRSTKPFQAKQIELIQNFAAQAVIAIENTRLLRELRESLQQQTATADVLKVISRSTFDLQTVLDTLTESAARVCAADKGVIFQRDGDFYRLGANYGFSREAEQYALGHPQRAGRGSAVGRVALEGRAIHIPDVLADPEYNATGYQQIFKFRTILGVPLLREGTTIGVFALTRDEVSPFTDKQIELVTTFADQAVIAIENVRLFENVESRTRELTVALEQQAATSEVLNVISRSKFDLQPILQSVVDTAARLCRADTAVIFRLDQGVYRFATGYCVDPRYMEIERATPIMPGPGTVVGRAAIQREVVRIVDAMADPLYEKKGDAEVAQVRSMIGVPLMREGEPIGVIALARQRVEPFADREIELVSTFADQAAIAIENVRLFEAEQQRTQELAKSLEELRTAQDRLVQTEKLASLGQLTAGIAHEIKNPLNFVNNFSSVSVELIDELREALESANLDGKLRTEIGEIADMLRGNLDKVVQHGKRADSIVKNMLLHSREGSGERRPVDVNALVEESLNLAYHGARAEKQGFNITLERSFDPAAGTVDLFPQEITRVLLNLISNGFYAATKRKAEAGGAGYEPTLTATTKDLGNSVEIKIRDNGTGIPAHVKEKMFNPFFTTKPAGEGTGLGLSISHDIIVKQHDGSIAVDTDPGQFTEFRIVLPRAGASHAKSAERP